MSEFQEVRKQLVTRQSALLERLGKLKLDAAKQASRDWSEQAQERENDEVVDALGREVEAELLQIGKAIARIDNDEYGYCVSCGGEIASERLAVMPFASMCIQCAEHKEH